MVCGHDLGAPPAGLGRVAYCLTAGTNHENSMVASAHLQRSFGMVRRQSVECAKK
jgi:hypothetical protein